MSTKSAEMFAVEEWEPKNLSRAQWEQVHKYRLVRHEEARPEDPITPDELVEKAMLRDDPFGISRRMGIIENDEIIAALEVSTMKETAPGYDSNKQFMWSHGDTHPEHRRRGIGTLWARKTLEAMDEWDKTICTTWVDEDSGKAFLAWLGAAEKQTFWENRLKFKEIDWPLMESWIKDGQERSPDLKLEMFEEELPDEFFEEYAPILTELVMTMPFDDLEHGEYTMTPETLKEQKERMKQMNSSLHTLVARAPDGRLAGMTDVQWNPSKPGYVGQRFTGVHPDFRGRGLGKLLKAYMVDFLRKKYDDLIWVTTGNAKSNDSMLAINRAMGFKEHKSASAFQITRDELRSSLEKIG